MARVCVILMVSLLSHLSSVSSWAHNNTAGWADEFPHCGGKNQSPIDLPDVCTKKGGVKLDPGLAMEFYSYGFDLPESKLDLVNTGHTLSLKLRNSDENANNGSPGVKFRDNFYQFSELHFHWNQRDNQGSDHTIAGKRFASELHLVHYNTKYKRMTSAVWKPDGLLVLGIMLNADREVNDAIQPILDQIDTVVVQHKPTFLSSPLNLLNMMPGRTDSFYSYTGSLTTPPCAEPVTWIVFIEKGKIGHGQLADLKRLSGGEDKKREIQPLNGRQISASTDDHCR